MSYRVTLVTLLLVFTFLFSREPLFIYNVAHNMASVVGVNVAIEENKYNRLAQELAAKENALNERERSLAASTQKESILSDTNMKSSYIIATILALLLLLVLINFYLDWKRTRMKLFSRVRLNSLRK